MRRVFWKRELRAILLLAGVTGVVLGGNACGLKASPEEAEVERNVSISFWNVFTGPDGEIMQQIVDDFNREYEGKIQVVTSVFSAESYYSTLSSAMIGGTAPDVCISHSSRIANFAQKEQLCVLDDLVKELGYSEEDFLPSAWENGTYQGKHYGIPLDIHQLGLYYNEDLLRELEIDQVPDNLPDFIAAAR